MLLAEVVKGTNTIELRERGYPPRHYFPREDVCMNLLSVSETTTYCPFKRHTVYFSLGEISGYRLELRATDGSNSRQGSVL